VVKQPNNANGETIDLPNSAPKAAMD
jgi:hypothetical protein